MKRLLVDRVTRPSVKYFGAHFDCKEAKAAIEQEVYSAWDKDPSSPALQRTRDALPDPVLEMLTWHAGAATFPVSILEKFAAGTSQHIKILDYKKQVEELYPPRAAGTTNGRANAQAPRAGGRPDYTIEGGERPLDLTRVVDLQKIKESDFKEDRLPVKKKELRHDESCMYGKCCDF